VLVDLVQLVGGEGRELACGEAVVELRDAAGADQHRRHPLVAHRPGQRHLRERLPPRRGHVVERADVGQRLFAEQVRRQ
jgi:hypothetical protein